MRRRLAPLMLGVMLAAGCGGSPEASVSTAHLGSPTDTTTTTSPVNSLPYLDPATGITLMALPSGVSMPSTPPTEAELLELYPDWTPDVEAVDSALAARLPSRTAIGPYWEFRETELQDHEFSVGPLASLTCDTADTPLWSGLTATFTEHFKLSARYARDAQLLIAADEIDPAAVDPWKTKLNTQTDCLIDNTKPGRTITRITEGLPPDAFLAQRIEFDGRLIEVAGESITFESDTTFVWLNRGNVIATVTVMMNENAAHPRAIDSTEEAIELAAAFDVS